MSSGITTSLRLNSEVRYQLECASRVLHRGKNSIINEALIAYLERFNQKTLVQEARRQSILASHCSKGADEVDSWEENSDQTDWT
jgi:predicted DNA-binding protein